MMSSGPQQRAEFSLRPVVAPALEPDGTRVFEAVASRGRVNTLDDLKSILALGADTGVILIPRKDINPLFLDGIARDAHDGHAPTRADWHGRWNETGGLTATNAMPHIHDSTNCHAAPKPTECPTAFFAREAVFRAVEEMSLNRRYEIGLRTQFRTALENAALEDRPTALFEALHAMEPSASRSQIELLRAVQDMQRRVEELGGLYRVGLGSSGYAIVVIPANCPHGRCTVDELTRESSTAWRYFAPSVRT